MRKLRLKGASSDTSLEQLALRTLQSTIVANPRTQNHFRSIGGLEVLLDGLGTPLTPAQRREVGQAESSPGSKKVIDLEPNPGVGMQALNKLLEDFQMQLLSLQVLREAMYPLSFFGSSLLLM